jgi:predicted TIM-barrel fold metal-dependent hydrolase
MKGIALAGWAVLWGLRMASAQEDGPIIDVHLHAGTVINNRICPGAGILGLEHADGSPVCQTPLDPAPSKEALRTQTLEAMRRHNIVGVVSGAMVDVDDWRTAASDRIIPAIMPAGPPADLDSLRRLIAERRVAVIGEVNWQYAGHAPNSPQLDPLYALAEELDVPLGIHVAGLGGPIPTLRLAFGDPVLLEDVLMKYPRLRLYVMHAGYPFIDRMISLMRHYPRVYLDVSWIVWQMPRVDFHDYLQRLVRHGFGKRIMFGTDQVAWPGTIDIAVDSIRSAAFLSAEQKRDIFYNNAARFLRLEPHRRGADR